MNKTCDILQEVRCYERKEKVLECDSECQKIQREKEEVVPSFSVHFHPELSWYYLKQRGFTVRLHLLGR